VRLYSARTVDTVLSGVMVYMHLRTTYRRAAGAVSVSQVTLWRWAMAVGEQIYQVFKAKTKKTVNKRYRAVMALQEECVAQMPDAQRIFDFLDRHYPKLVNAVENPLIPLTNNTVELVIRRTCPVPLVPGA
jgi:hypothetical protein